MARKRAAPAADGWDAPRLAGLTLAFAGDFEELDPRAEARRVKAEGGTVVKEVAPQVDYLIVGDRTRDREAIERLAAERDRQEGAHVAVLSERAYLALYSPTREQALAMFRAGAAGLKRWRRLCEFGPGAPVDLSGADLRGL